jgi:malate dehydrogenase (oxaloacetate-decarboxylating)
MGLGILAVGARRVSDAMFMAACKAVADLSPAAPDNDARLLPPVRDLRAVAMAVANAVAAQAQIDGLAAPCDAQSLQQRIEACRWEPLYLPYECMP